MKIFKLFDIDEQTPPPASERPAHQPPSSNDPPPLIYNPISSQREAEERHKAVYAAHQDAICKAGQCRADINKGILSGESPFDLLLKAIECISLMTGEKLFYSQNREQIKAIYGAGLLEVLPLEWELDEVQQRLKMLTRPELDNEPEESKRRIQTAVKAHNDRVLYLQAQIDRGEPAAQTSPTAPPIGAEDTQPDEYSQRIKGSFDTAYNFISKHKRPRTDTDWNAIVGDIGAYSDPLTVGLVVECVAELEREYKEATDK